MRYVADNWSPAPFQPDGSQRVRLPFQQVDVTVQDLRCAAEAAPLAVSGFELLEHKSGVTDFSDADQIGRTYLAEVEELVRTVTGAKAVFAYPLAVQRSNKHMAHQSGIITDVIAPVVHIDATPRSIGMIAAAALARAGLSKPPTGRVAYYTVWRSLRPPPQDQALALCDVRSIEADDLVPAEAVDNPGNLDARAEYYLLRANPRHNWFYYSGMEAREVLVFRQFDSSVEGPSGCAHSSFATPHAAAAMPRLSIEARACAFLD